MPKYLFALPEVPFATFPDPFGNLRRLHLNWRLWIFYFHLGGTNEPSKRKSPLSSHLPDNRIHKKCVLN